MILKNGLVMTKDFELKELDIEVCDGKIKNIGTNLEGEETVDLNENYLLPGFIDSHIHGAYGARISDDNADLSKITEFEKNTRCHSNCNYHSGVRVEFTLGAN